MSDTLSFAELDGQHVELLPARTVLSLFNFSGANGGIGGAGSDATGTVGANIGKINFGGHQVNILGSIVGAPGANANG